MTFFRIYFSDDKEKTFILHYEVFNKCFIFFLRDGNSELALAFLGARRQGWSLPMASRARALLKFYCLWTNKNNSQKANRGVYDIYWKSGFSKIGSTKRLFMRQRAYVEILSTREVWRARKRHTSSLLSALQTSQVLNISTYAQLTHELIVL